MYTAGQVIFTFFLGIATGMITTPVYNSYTYDGLTLSATNYQTALAIMNQVFMGIAATVAVICILVNFLRSSVASNIRQNMTLEIAIELLAKYILLYVALVNIQYVMYWIISLGSSMLSGVMDVGGVGDTFGTWDAFFGIVEEDISIDGVLTDLVSSINILNLFFSIMYIAVAFSSGITLITTIGNRYIQMLVLVATAPVAVATAGAGGMVSHTAWNFIRTFLGKTFVIIVYGIIFVICIAISSSADPGELSILGIRASRIMEVISMMLTAAAIKGADQLMVKAYNL